MEKGRLGRLSERAGRNASERPAGLEKVNAEADPPSSRGRLPATGTVQWDANENGRSSPPGYWRQHVRAGKRMQRGKPCRWRARASRKPVSFRVRCQAPEARKMLRGAKFPAGRCGDHAAASTGRAGASGCQSRSWRSKAVRRVTSRRMTATTATLWDLPRATRRT